MSLKVYSRPLGKYSPELSLVNDNDQKFFIDREIIREKEIEI